jgi:hypothetical protein
MSARSTGTERANTTSNLKLGAWVQGALLVATGFAFAFWICHLESSQAAHGLSLLFLAVVLASWPAYVAWWHCTRASRKQQPVEEIERKAIFHEGYVEGYLRGVTDRLTGADPQEVP